MSYGSSRHQYKIDNIINDLENTIEYLENSLEQLEKYINMISDLINQATSIGIDVKGIGLEEINIKGKERWIEEAISTLRNNYNLLSIHIISKLLNKDVEVVSSFFSKCFKNSFKNILIDDYHDQLKYLIKKYSMYRSFNEVLSDYILYIDCEMLTFKSMYIDKLFELNKLINKFLNLYSLFYGSSSIIKELFTYHFKKLGSGLIYNINDIIKEVSEVGRILDELVNQYTNSRRLIEIINEFNESMKKKYNTAIAQAIANNIMAGLNKLSQGIKSKCDLKTKDYKELLRSIRELYDLIISCTNESNNVLRNGYDKVIAIINKIVNDDVEKRRYIESISIRQLTDLNSLKHVIEDLDKLDNILNEIFCKYLSENEKIVLDYALELTWDKSISEISFVSLIEYLRSKQLDIDVINIVYGLCKKGILDCKIII